MDRQWFARTWALVVVMVVAGSPATRADVAFPAYGPPASGAAVTVPVPGIAAHVSLAQAIAIAAATAPQLTAARSTDRLARANALLAETPAAPELSANAAYSSGLQGGLASSSVEKSVGLQLQQLIYDGGRTIAQVRSARSALDAAGQTYERALQTLAYDVARAYYGALQAQSQVRVQLDIVGQDMAQERLISAQIRAGTVAPIDLETAQIPTAQARVAVVRAQGDELAALAAFAASMGLRADAGVEPAPLGNADEAASLLPASVPSAYLDAVVTALRRRPDVLAALAAVRSAEQALRAARRGRAPVILAGAQDGFTSLGASGAPLQATGGVQAQLSIPLDDRGVTNAQTAQAQAQLELARAQFEQTRIDVESDVRQGLVQLVASQAALAQTGFELSKARDVLAATQRQYRAGQTTLPLLLNAQAQIAGAQTDRSTAVYALRAAEQTYLYALGENALAEGTSP